MARKVVVLSGAVASGKTTLCDALRTRFGFTILKTRDLIKARVPDVQDEREALQRAGEALDRKHRGRWVSEALIKLIEPLDREVQVIVDSVRIVRQVDGIRAALGAIVTHVHLTAPEKELAKRYRKRKGAIRELPNYSAVMADPTEAGIESLAAVADVCIDTKRSDAADVLVRVASYLGLYGRGRAQLVDVLVGGQYGSEGKGHIASYLAREYDILVRVGGPNAGHKVYQEPEPYTFHQLPSGTAHNPNALLVVGAGAVVSLPSLRREIADWQVPYERLCVDPNAIIICPEDRRKEKTSLAGTIGSTAQGVGWATARKVLRTAARPPVKRAEDTPSLLPYVRSSLEVFEEAFANGRRVFLEGTQGTGLSIHHGHYPFVTSRDTSVGGCLAEAGLSPTRVRKTIMACRTYPIRVESPTGQSSGPMKSEMSWPEVSRRSGIPDRELERTERTSTTNRRRRVGEFDWELLRKAVSLNGPTDIALTFTDYIDVSNKDARRFEQLTPDTIRFIEEVERVADAPVSLITTRFHSRSIIDRRKW